MASAPRQRTATIDSGTLGARRTVDLSHLLTDVVHPALVGRQRRLDGSQPRQSPVQGARVRVSRALRDSITRNGSGHARILDD